LITLLNNPKTWGFIVIICDSLVDFEEYDIWKMFPKKEFVNKEIAEKKKQGRVEKEKVRERDRGERDRERDRGERDRGERERDRDRKRDREDEGKLEYIYLIKA